MVIGGKTFLRTEDTEQSQVCLLGRPKHQANHGGELRHGQTGVSVWWKR